MTTCLKPYSCKLKRQQCSRRSPACWAQRVDTQVDWPNCFWDMTKCLKPYSCKLNKQQCSRRSPTCWAQRVDTQIDLPNSFWDMTKCLKPYSFKLKRQQCSRRSPAEHNALTLRSICPIVSEIWQNVLNLILANWINNSVVGAAPTCWAQHADTQDDWPSSFWNMTKCLKHLFLQIEETTV